MIPTVRMRQTGPGRRKHGPIQPYADRKEAASQLEQNLSVMYNAHFFKKKVGIGLEIFS